MCIVYPESIRKMKKVYITFTLVKLCARIILLLKTESVQYAVKSPYFIRISCLEMNVRKLESVIL